MHPNAKHVFWPNSTPVFIISLLLLIFSGSVIGAMLVIMLLLFFSYWRRIQISEHFVTALELPGLSDGVIIQKPDIRFVTAKKKFGECLVLDDRRSQQEIRIYKWLFNPYTIQAIQKLIQGAS